jgi:hypothetical protein
VQTAYWKRASKRFLKGTPFKSPCDVVNAGARTLGEWAQVLEEERNIDLAQRASDAMTRTKRTKHGFAPNPT